MTVMNVTNESIYVLLYQFQFVTCSQESKTNKNDNIPENNHLLITYKKLTSTIPEIHI